MSAAAMYMLCYGTMPDELFALLMAIPLAFIVALLGDAALERWRDRV